MYLIIHIDVSNHSKKPFRVCLVPHFTQKIFGFWPIILQNGTKYHAKFLTKRYSFSILNFGLKRKKSQKAKKLSPTP
jgi:Golgi nucleoside diphosphatase